MNKYVRVTLTSPSGNTKTRFQMGWLSVSAENIVPALASYAIKNGNGFVITYAKNFLARDAEEMNRVNRILTEVGC